MGRPSPKQSHRINTLVVVSLSMVLLLGGTGACGSRASTPAPTKRPTPQRDPSVQPGSNSETFNNLQKRNWSEFGSRDDDGFPAHWNSSSSSLVETTGRSHYNSSDLRKFRANIDSTEIFPTLGFTVIQWSLHEILKNH